MRQGLAATGAMGQGIGQIGQNQGQGNRIVMEVAKLLMQGVTPEELVQQGVPIEIIEIALQQTKNTIQPQKQKGKGLAGINLLEEDVVS